MGPYTSEQVTRYYERINFNPDARHGNGLSLVTALVRLQLTHVPFESLGLHYSVGRQISLDTEDLFDKIVGRRRGGYCLENNTFFRAVLRSIGFQVYGVICRITNATRGIFDGSFRAMYFPSSSHGESHRTLSEHSDPNQQVWIYCQRTEDGDWKDIYNFHDAEFFSPDFDVLNHYNMTVGHFTRTVTAQIFLPGPSESTGLLSGSVMLIRDRIEKRQWPTEPETLQTLTREDERITACANFFGISLTKEEADAIKGTQSEFGTMTNA